MRRTGFVLAIAIAIAGCSVSDREMRGMIGKTEAELLAAYGTPADVYNSGNSRWLAFELREVNVGAGLAVAARCRRSFELVDGRVRRFTTTGCPR